MGLIKARGSSFIGEAALRQEVGGPAVLDGQLGLLAGVSGDSGIITVQVLPFSSVAALHLQSYQDALRAVGWLDRIHAGSSRLDERRDGPQLIGKTGLIQQKPEIAQC